MDEKGLVVNLGFDPVAFCTALFAIWFAFHEARKSNNVLIKIRKCVFSGVQSIDENQCRYFSKLTILLQNRGISLHNLHVSLNFAEKNGCGSINVPLKRENSKTSNHDEFARGMLAEFYFKSYQLNDAQKSLLRDLKDAQKQKARLCVYSQNYLAKTFKAGGTLDRLKHKWNNIAIRIKSGFERQVGINPEGMPIIKRYNVVPTFEILEFNIMSFISSCEGSE